MGKNKKILVAAGLIVGPDNKILIAQRPRGKTMAGLWEFPGGKVMAGEEPAAALCRELKEELGIDVKRDDLSLIETIFHAYEEFQLEMPVFLCRQWAGTPKSLEHQALAWVSIEKLPHFPMPPADAPFVAKIPDFLFD